MDAMWRWREWWRRRRAPATPAPEVIAARWVETRDPALRAAVVESGAVAPPDPDFRPERADGSPRWYVVDHAMAPHFVTLALHRRLDEAPALGVARGLRVLVEDPDPDVVAAGVEFARTASGPVLSMLWRAHAWLPHVREILLANPRPLPDDAVDAVWWAWLSTQDRRLWEKLDGRPATSGPERRLSRIVLGLATPAETCAAALSGGSSDVVVAHAVALCRDRGYAPDDPAARAALFVLTGQAARYRELDPESALLARAYRRAPQRLRRRLRAAMSEVEGIDLVRVLTGGGWGRRALTEVEREYLVRTLVGRRAWEELWRLALLLPLVHAVELARQFDGWRPPEGRDLVLFDRLLAVRVRDLRKLADRDIFERQPHLLRKATPDRLRHADQAAADLLRARVAYRYGES